MVNTGKNMPIKPRRPSGGRADSYLFNITVHRKNVNPQAMAEITEFVP